MFLLNGEQAGVEKLAHSKSKPPEIEARYRFPEIEAPISLKSAALPLVTSLVVIGGGRVK